MTRPLVVAVVLGVGLEKHDAVGILVAEERDGLVGGVFEVAERDDVAVGLDGVEDAVRAGEGLDEPVLA